jgi:glycosyltransferase involved in cell wall biosynthesis
VNSPVTVILLTLNEEKNIVECLGSLRWCDDVIIVDSGSVDQTIGAALQARPDLRVLNHLFLDFGDQRNWALDNAQPKHEWILFLDADERATERFVLAVNEAVLNPGGNAGFFVCPRNIFMGRWIKHSTLYPSYQLRLLRHGKVRYQCEGHGQREVTDSPLGYIQEPYDHYPFSKGLDEWSARHRRYYAAEVELMLRLAVEPLKTMDLLSGPIERRRCLKRISARMPWLRLTVFIYLYFFRLGFMDGLPGFRYCRLRLAQEIQLMRNMASQMRGKVS